MNDNLTNAESMTDRVYGRRAADIEEMINSRTRIAVLEKISENHEHRIGDMEDFHRSVVERLDQKIQHDAMSQIIIERTLVKAVTSIDGLSDSLKSVLSVANDAKVLASKHETIGHTVMKMGGIGVMVVAAVWAILRLYLGV